MKSIESGSFDLQELDVTRQDEFGLLNRGFVHMTHELSHLVQDLLTVQKAKQRAEIQVLQAQIKPHFLYNTLSSCLLYTSRCV